ncbi:MAG TPA: bifunctional UDP-N-acetylmuramoyl-tripeptide:D-alanyl-D-alanine ligase/alanine racemase [Flavipsychrobacter sp.]|nr:bifunctional UDP-N-acetylmuramoyl-tripeptide:D-alanyl-D-alanine ligase/alanine racemase [Flavipsychrobacter sp.]
MRQEVSTELIKSWCNGEWLAHDKGVIVEDLIIDSRKIDRPENALFIAIKTNLRDGHNFISDAYEKGVRNFLVSQRLDTSQYPATNFLLVKDTLIALQQIAATYRKQFKIPVIGITGSNGKTITKEWLYQLLSDSYQIVRSPKSFNSQVGVPLSVWLLEKDHQLAIFEAGISQPAEMEKLERIIQPTIGIFTNIGEAHSEGFLNTRQKINEKLVLFRHAKQLIYCKDYPELNECIVQYFNQLKGHESEQQLQLFTWSQKTEADLRILSMDKTAGKTAIKALYNGKEINITIPFIDPASIENAIHCWCTMLLLDVNQEYIQQQMLLLQPVSMRLELKHGINACTIINDTYNSDLTSLHIALDYLEQQKQHKHHTVILSDMLQVGRPDTDLYEEVAALTVRRNINRFIGIGPALYKHKAIFRKYKKLRSIFFKSTDEFLKKFHLLTFNDEAVLLKGARVFAFEKIGLLLEQKIHQTILSINLSALTHNLNTFRARLQPGVKTMAMVKAFAYGSGSYEIANLLQFSGVDYLAVAYTDEGIGLRKAGITMPIMVMSPDAISFDRMIAWKLEPEIFSLHSLDSFIDIARMLGINNYPVHIKLDTGMHRLGFMPDEIDTLVQKIENSTQVHIASIFSHLAASEDAAFDDFTKKQAAAFQEMSTQLQSYLSYKPLRHLCNSAAIVRHPELQFDMVRLGIGLYGIDSSNILQDQLKQIGTLKTTIAQIKTVPQGDTIGYGRKGIATDTTRIATICIGYADGYSRSLGNGIGHVLIHNKPAKVIGVIAMDMCMVDISDIPEAKEGDDVVIFSSELPVTLLAKWADTIPYEIMTGISQRVKRVYVNEE